MREVARSVQHYLQWESLQITKHKLVQWAERTPNWLCFALCRVSRVVDDHLEQSHTQSVFLFPVFKILGALGANGALEKKLAPGVWRLSRQNRWRPGTVQWATSSVGEARRYCTVRIHGRGRGRIVIDRGRGCSAKISPIKSTKNMAAVTTGAGRAATESRRDPSSSSWSESVPFDFPFMSITFRVVLFSFFNLVVQPCRDGRTKPFGSPLSSAWPQITCGRESGFSLPFQRSSSRAGASWLSTLCQTFPKGFFFDNSSSCPFASSNCHPHDHKTTKFREGPTLPYAASKSWHTWTLAPAPLILSLSLSLSLSLFLSLSFSLSLSLFLSV